MGIFEKKTMYVGWLVGWLVGWMAVEIVVEIGKRAKKISAANDLCAIEINPKFIYFCHKPECSQGKKDFWPKPL